MIESLSIRNFKVLREVDLELKPLTVIVGPNASGKSSILQAISLCLNRSKKPREHELGLLRSRTSQEAPCITARIDGATIRVDFRSRFSESISSDSGWTSLLLDLDPHKLASPYHPTTVSTNLPSDGEGLSSILAGLQSEKPDRFAEIVKRLQEVVPTVEGLRTRRVLLGPAKVGYEVLFDMLGAKGIPAATAGHGTLLTLGILTTLALNDSPQVVLIEDLERGIHPSAIPSFIQQIRGIQNPQIQIVATSHSPYLIDQFSFEEILTTSLDSEGYAIVKPLTEHSDYEYWKGYMKPGEFWSSVGESWLTEESMPAEEEERVR